MPVLEEALFDYLSEALSSIVDDRIFPLHLPEGCDLPAVAYQRITTRREYTHGPFDSQEPFTQPLVQVTCWAREPLGAIVLSEAVVESLSGYSGPMGTLRVSAVIENEIDLGYDAETKLSRRIVDIRFGYHELKQGGS